MAFRKGKSGNPNGRPRGIATQTKLREAIAKDVPEILTAMANAAKGGDTAAAKLLLDRTVPALKPTTEATTFTTGQTLADSGRAILEAVAKGQIAPDQGTSLISALAGLSRVIEVDELTKRIEALEQAAPPAPDPR